MPQYLQDFRSLGQYIKPQQTRIWAFYLSVSFHYCKYKRGMKTNFTYLLMIAFQDEIEEDPTGGRIKWEQGKLNRAPNKVEEIVQFHVGDVVTYFQKASLLPCGGEYIVF
ncbi:spliceosome-associated protein 130 A-like isoform X4 [Cajanus cajan]|uniref:spliceosome-associated protein 130 A-like isoform X4 n=1 Tax=Cajanus cajan TaxID=3821 RepID=UPI0010FB0F1F|nr:spliceosome-associated protein 130 A-like isoform X4 [Cajanus cajan]